MTRGLADTSLFIARADTSLFVAREVRRALDAAHAAASLAVSIITVGELRAGVLGAQDLATRSRRLTTLELVMTLEPIPIDASVAEAWTELRIRLRDAGTRMKVNDSWIAATALALGVPVVTLDADFDGVPGLRVVRV